MSDQFNLLENALTELHINYTDKMVDQFKDYMKLVLEWNEKINLTAIKEEREFIIKHYIDSILCADKMDLCQKIIDIGTGAGFPGIPLSIIFPQKSFLLIDSLNKRIKFINEAAQEIGLQNVRAVHGRAEDFGSSTEHREQYDLCVSRAVAKLNVLSEYCLPFVKVGGHFAAYKSMDIEEELNESTKALKVLGGKMEQSIPLSLKDINIDHQIIYIKKYKNTPKEYPRKSGIPEKKPLK